MITTAAGRSSARIGVVTPGHVLRSEWTKLRSLRSTYWSLLVAVLALSGLGMLFAAIKMSEWSRLAVEDPRMLAAERAHFSSIDAAVGGYHLAQLAVGVLGVLVISAEYTTGMIRASLMAVPTRLAVLWTKLAVFGGVTFVLMLWCALVGFFGVQAIVAHEGVDSALGDPDALRVVVGTALYITAVGALGLGLGALLRNTAAAISTFVAVLFVLPGIVALAASRPERVDRPVPAAACGLRHRDGAARTAPDDLAPWAGFGLFCGYVAVVVGLAAWRLAREDA